MPIYEQTLKTSWKTPKRAQFLQANKQTVKKKQSSFNIREETLLTHCGVARKCRTNWYTWKLVCKRRKDRQIHTHTCIRTRWHRNRVLLILFFLNGIWNTAKRSNSMDPTITSDLVHPYIFCSLSIKKDSLLNSFSTFSRNIKAATEKLSS